MIAQRRIKCISVLRVLNSFFNGISSSAITTIVYPGWREKWLNLFSLSVTNPFFDRSWNFLIICLNFEKIFFSSSNDDDRVSFLAWKWLEIIFSKRFESIFRWICLNFKKILLSSSNDDDRVSFCIFRWITDQFHRSFVTIRLNLGEILRKNSLSIEQRLREAE